MEIITYTNEYESEYNDYTRRVPNILFFYSIQYINVLTKLLNAKNETMLAIENNKIIGVLPLLSKNGQYGKVLNSLPFYGSNGFIIANNEIVYDLILEKYNILVNSNSVFSSTIVTNPLIELNNLDASIVHNYKDYRIGQFTNFQSDCQDLMDMFHYKTRNMIRKALKSDIEVFIDNNRFDFLEKVHYENMQEIGGKAKNNSFFSLVQKDFIAGIDYNIYIAKKDGIMISALLLFYFNETVEYYTPVVKVEYRGLQPLSAIIYTAMQDAICNGFKRWNWGGTWATQDGVYRFKKRWGTEDINYHYYTQLNYDKSKLSKDVLLKEYEYFYTLPFNELEQGELL